MSEKSAEPHLDEIVNDTFNLRVERNLKAIAQAVSDSDEDRADLPEWVRNVQIHLNETIYGGLKEQLERGLQDPRALGLAIGHTKRAKELIETQLERMAEQVDLSEYSDEVLARLEKLGEKWNELIYPTKDFDGFDILASGYLNKAYFSWPYTDAHNFFKGISEGLFQLTGYSGDWKDQRQNTPVLLHMFVYWHVVEYEIENIPQLRNWLLRFFKASQVGQDTRRMEKMCERIKLRIARPGRPKNLPVRKKRKNTKKKK